MPKSSTKKDGKALKKIPSKDELIDTMTYYLNLQKEIAATKEKQYKQFEEERSNDDRKVKNPYLNELNCQIDAIIRSSTALIRINGSNLETEQEEENPTNNKKKELVD